MGLQPQTLRLLYLGSGDVVEQKVEEAKLEAAHARLAEVWKEMSETVRSSRLSANHNVEGERVAFLYMAGGPRRVRAARLEAL